MHDGLTLNKRRNKSGGKVKKPGSRNCRDGLGRKWPSPVVLLASEAVARHIAEQEFSK